MTITEIQNAIDRCAIGIDQTTREGKAKAINATLETSDRKKELAKLLSVTVRAITGWVSDLDQAEREERKAKIKEMYLKAYTAEEIGEAVGSVDVVKKELPCLLEDIPKSTKVQFSEDDWQPPIYNVWTFAKKTNATSHFGNTEQRIVDNLLWAYTQPLDIVIDPFGGGGSTLDVCDELL